MSAKEINVAYSNASTFPEYLLSSVRNIARSHYIDYKAFSLIGLVNTNNIDIGLIGIIETNETLEVRLFQAPNVCRMSILSLIDSSIYFLQSIVKNEQTVIFKSVHYAHTFKLQQIIKDVTIEGDDFITTGHSLLGIDMSLISLKNIILEKI